MRTLVFTIVVGDYAKLFADCLSSQVSYCERHGYTYLALTRAPRLLEAHEASWLKIPLIRTALMTGRYDWVAFIDADCEIRSHSPGFHEAFARRPESLLVAPGQSGRINAGVLFARPGAIEIFTTILEKADSPVPPEDRAPYENGHVIHVGKAHPGVGLVEHQLWNNNSVFDPSSYIQHYAQGPIRQQYLRTHYDGPRRPLLRLFAFRVRNRLMRNRVTKISGTLAELMPFYLNQYPEFGPATPAQT